MLAMYEPDLDKGICRFAARHEDHGHRRRPCHKGRVASRAGRKWHRAEFKQLGTRAQVLAQFFAARHRHGVGKNLVDAAFDAISRRQTPAL